MRRWLYRAVGLRLLALANLLLARATARSSAAPTDAAGVWVRDAQGRMVVNHRGPPADWLRRVRKGAPQLLEATAPSTSPPDQPAISYPPPQSGTPPQRLAQLPPPVAEQTSTREAGEPQISVPPPPVRRITPLVDQPPSRARALPEPSPASAMPQLRGPATGEVEKPPAVKHGPAAGETQTEARLQAREPENHLPEVPQGSWMPVGTRPGPEGGAHPEKLTRALARSGSVFVPFTLMRRHIAEPGVSVTVAPATHKRTFEVIVPSEPQPRARSLDRVPHSDHLLKGLPNARWPDLPAPEPPPNETTALLGLQLRRQAFLDAEQRRR